MTGKFYLNPSFLFWTWQNTKLETRQIHLCEFTMFYKEAKVFGVDIVGWSTTDIVGLSINNQNWYDVE